MTTESSIAHVQHVDKESARSRVALIITSLLVTCVAVGAALGAGLHPASSRVRAESQLTVIAPTPGLQPIAWRTVGQVLKLSHLRAQIAELGGADTSGLRIGTSGDPESSLITVYADAGTAAQAEILANSAASVAVNFLRQTVDAAPVTRSTFEQSTEAWNVGTGVYVLPGRIQQSHAIAHRGSGSLEASCVTLVTGGCGSYLRLESLFRKGSAYLAQGWIKAPPGTSIRIVLGSTPQDVAVGATAAGARGWKRLAVTWVPQREGTLGIVAFQVMSRGTSHFNIDDVEVGALTAIQRGAVASTNAPRYETIVPATSSSKVGGGHTGEWAAGGAAAGLVIGAAAVGAAGAARRRRDKPRPDQETLF